MSEAKKPQRKWLLIVVAVAGLGACIPCSGVLLAVGLPAFVNYHRRARTAEVGPRLDAIFRGAAAYYESEHLVAGVMRTGCTVDPATTTNRAGPDEAPIAFSSSPSFTALGVPDDGGRYRYEIVAPPSTCGHAPGDALYSFRAHGDLDADGTESLFEMSVGAESDGTIFRAPGLYTENELE